MAKQSSSAGARFWNHRNEPYADEIRYVDGWYWIDDDCEEPMGPFDSRSDAEADYRDSRAPAPEFNDDGE